MSTKRIPTEAEIQLALQMVNASPFKTYLMLQVNDLMWVRKIEADEGTWFYVPPTYQPVLQNHVQCGRTAMLVMWTKFNVLPAEMQQYIETLMMNAALKGAGDILTAARLGNSQALDTLGRKIVEG